jgi:hypothetical protein
VQARAGWTIENQDHYVRHGFSRNAVWHNTLLEHNASHSFVVVAPEHVDEWDPESGEKENPAG